jgi:hypothetical protein
MRLNRRYPQLDALVGTYQVPHGIFTFAREGERLPSQASGRRQGHMRVAANWKGDGSCPLTAFGPDCRVKGLLS